MSKPMKTAAPTLDEQLAAARDDLRAALDVERPLIERCGNGRRALAAAEAAAEKTNACYRRIAELAALEAQA